MFQVVVEAIGMASADGLPAAREINLGSLAPYSVDRELYQISYNKKAILNTFLYGLHMN